MDTRTHINFIWGRGLASGWKARVLHLRTGFSCWSLAQEVGDDSSTSWVSATHMADLGSVPFPPPWLSAYHGNEDDF